MKNLLLAPLHKHLCMNELGGGKKEKAVVNGLSSLEVLAIALGSRVLVFFLWCVLDWFLLDHQPSGDVAQFDLGGGSCAAAGRDDDEQCFHCELLRSFTRWDAAHYLKISQEGYIAEQSFVFLPIFPMTIRYIAILLRACTSLEDLFTSEQILVISGVVVSNVSFVLSALVLMRICDDIFNLPSRVTRISILLFSFNPASVFFSAIYTESMYSLFNFLGIYCYEKKSLPASCFSFAIASGIRSNGWMNVIPIFIDIFGRTTIIKELDWSKLGALFCSIVPFILWNIFAYFQMCSSEKNSSSPLSILSSYCFNGITPLISPYVYGYLQQKYWNVGFLKQYQFRQLPNFLIASPTIWYCLAFMNKKFTVHGDTYSLYAKYRIHMLSIVILVALFAHIQIIARVVYSSCPIIYICFARELVDASKVSATAFQILCVMYFALYFFVGIGLHANFYPWT